MEVIVYRDQFGSAIVRTTKDAYDPSLQLTVAVIANNDVVQGEDAHPHGPANECLCQFTSQDLEWMYFGEYDDAYDHLSSHGPMMRALTYQPKANEMEHALEAHEEDPGPKRALAKRLNDADGENKLSAIGKARQQKRLHGQKARERFTSRESFRFLPELPWDDFDPKSCIDSFMCPCDVCEARYGSHEYESEYMFEYSYDDSCIDPYYGTEEQWATLVEFHGDPYDTVDGEEQNTQHGWGNTPILVRTETHLEVYLDGPGFSAEDVRRFLATVVQSDHEDGHPLFI